MFTQGESPADFSGENLSNVDEILRKMHIICMKITQNLYNVQSNVDLPLQIYLQKCCRCLLWEIHSISILWEHYVKAALL